MIIQIDGWFAGGKGVLWSLLDGHKDIFVNPVHDFSYASLLDKSDSDEWVKKRHTTFLRKTLAASEYYKFEKLFLEKSIEFSFATDVSKVIPYEADFYKFDQKFYSKLNSYDIWSINSIVKTLYKTYYEEYTQQSSYYPKYYATMSNAWKYKYYKNIPTLFPDMKSIVVKRGLKNIIATRTNRTQRAKDLNSFQAFCTPFDVIIQRKEVDWILKYFHTNEQLQKEYPEQFLIVDFDDLVKRPHESMKKVASFLNIDFDKILTIPTRDSILLEHNGVSFIGKENDDYKELLSQNEIDTLDKMQADFYKDNQL